MPLSVAHGLLAASIAAASLAGTPLCEVEHVGMVVGGRAMAAMSDRTEVELRHGTFNIPSVTRDSWVIGDEPYVSLQSWERSTTRSSI